jgi:hypothetical protein
VTFTLFRLDGNGKKEKAASADFHAKDGKVEGEFKLELPKGSKVADPVPHIFTAGHRDSKEVTSPKLNVSEPARTLVCEFDDHSELKKPGYALVLKDAGGKVHTKLKFEDGLRSGYVIYLRFPESRDLSLGGSILEEVHPLQASSGA